MLQMKFGTVLKQLQEDIKTLEKAVYSDGTLRLQLMIVELIK